VPQTEHVQAILNLGSTAKRVELEFGTHQHQTDSEAVGLAKELIDAESGRLEPEKMRDKYAEKLRELLKAKVEQRAASNRGCAGGQGSPKEVINIMAALKENTQAKGRPKCGMRCRDEWASSLRRKSHGRALHDHGQARVGRRKLAVLLDLAALVELLLLAAPVFLPLSFPRC